MKHLLLLLLATMILTSCTFVTVDGQTVVVQTEEQLEKQTRLTYMDGAFTGCWVTHILQYEMAGRPITEADEEYIFQTCLRIAYIAESLRSEPEPTPEPPVEGEPL